MSLPDHPLARPWLRLAAAAYAAVLRARDRRYRGPGTVRRAALPVISVGNLTVGGTGKTPIVAWLARRLGERGARVAVVSRGYGGRAGRGPLVVSHGAGPACGADLCGDEPWLLARALPGVPVVVGADRHAAAGAAARLGAGSVLLDDGFQHRRLARDLDVVLLNGADPFGNGRLLPAGPLREPLEALGRAGVLLLTRTAADERRPALRETLGRHNPHAPILAADHHITAWVDWRGAEAAPPARAVAFCGIGDPLRFRRDLSASGVEIVAFQADRDHHRYSAAALARLALLAERHDCVLLTTEKDLARIGPAAQAHAARLRAARIEAVVHDPEPLLRAALEAIAGRPA